ncbi:hypothetical protein C8A01DRAFT_50292 [Parachaetomium inaequale]|uniref:Uncharacterized protein n=1 Tax=Parachaetomium inaequale TaxID=2588326 RepID=A0AAN6PA39_9PEZI|nr:hypothetical protein C8A01DRAFT_50292 [Parachaetomium inaequale]
MDRTDQRLPRLTQEELANPYTRISLDGIELQLWQVAHVYGVSHDMPSPTLRAGASSRDFRVLYSRQRDRGAASPTIPTNIGIANITEGRHVANSPIVPSSIPERREAQRPAQRVTVRGNGRDDSETHNLLRLIDELVDESWSSEEENKEPQHTTAVSVATLLGTASNIKGIIWADPSFPPPLHPPPNRPLPLLPQRPAESRRHVTHRGPRLATLPGKAPRSTSRASPKSAEDSEPLRDDDAESERTITPSTSRRQLAPTSRTRDVSMPTAKVVAERPAAIHAAGRAASASILRRHGEESYHPRRQNSALTEAREKLVPPPLPHPLPDFLLNPPSFLQHPPDLSQQPPQNHQPGVTARGSPRLNKSKSSSRLAATATRAATSASDDDTALTSRWSSDSEEEEESKIKKLKRVFSLSRLRPRKSSLFQKQTGSEANKSAASVGKRTSGSSGSRRNSKAGN